MANPDDSDFEDFVIGAMDCTFSSVINDYSDDSEANDSLLHNLPISDLEDESDENVIQPAQVLLAGEPNWCDVSNGDPGPTNTVPIYNVNAGPCLPLHFN